MNYNCLNNFNIKILGLCEPSKLNFYKYPKTHLNWVELNITDLSYVCSDILKINQVSGVVNINSLRLIQSPFAYKSYPLFRLLQPLIDELTTSLNTLKTNVSDFFLGMGSNFFNPILLPLTSIGMTDIFNSSFVNFQDSYNNILALADLLLNDLNNTTDYLIPTIKNYFNDIVLELDKLILNIQNLTPIMKSAIPQIQTLKDNGLIDTIHADASILELNKALSILLDPNSWISNYYSIFVNTRNEYKSLNLNYQAFNIIPNAEGVCLSGRILIINGYVSLNMVYTSPNLENYMANFTREIPFVGHIIAYPNFNKVTYSNQIEIYDELNETKKTVSGFITNDFNSLQSNLCENFKIELGLEDIASYNMSNNNIFNRITLFLKAIPQETCS